MNAADGHVRYTFSPTLETVQVDLVHKNRGRPTRIDLHYTVPE